MAKTSMLMKSEYDSNFLRALPLFSLRPVHRAILTSVSSPADVIFSALLNDKTGLKTFIKTNQSRLSQAQMYTRQWFQDRGVAVADSNAYVAHFQCPCSRVA